MLSNDIKTLFFEDILTVLSKRGFGQNFLAFPGGGNIKGGTATFMFFLNNFTVRCEVHHYGILAGNVAKFDIRDPNSREEIITWAMNERNSL